MNAAQALLHQIASEEYVAAWDLIDDDLQNAITEELERADTTPTHTVPIHRTDPDPHGLPTARPPLETTYIPDPDTAWKAGPVVGEQTMRRFGLVRDELPAAPLEVRHTDIGDGWTETSISTGHIDPDALRRAALNAEIDAAGKGD